MIKLLLLVVMLVSGDLPPVLGGEFDQRYQRDYNIFDPLLQLRPDDPLNPMRSVFPSNPFNRINEFDPGNPVNPLNRYRPTIPSTRSISTGLIPLNPLNQYNMNVPFQPLR